MTIRDSDTIDLDGTTVDVDELPTCAVGDVLADRYRLDEEIGRGGLGVVFRAWDAELERQVAVKMLAARAGLGDARDRLLHEARAAAALSHPHVATVHDVGEHGEVPFLVMELVGGPSLKERRPETLEGIVALALQICDALGHAHSHGLVHRDLKPANVLYTSASGPADVKLVDLGLALRGRGAGLARGGGIDGAGGITGTVAYMAPEQALGRELDGRADLYALGVVLYELTTGRRPFEGDTPLAVLSQHLHAPVVRPGIYRPDLPEHLEAVILRLLAKDPADRFASADDVAEALARPPAAGPATGSPGASAALGGLIRGRMVGRDAEMETLRERWSAAVRGRGGLAVISGEPGAGKSRLARELVDLARITGGTTLAGGCYELEAGTPYLPFVEALRGWVRTSSDDELRGAAGSAGAELARLAPEIADRIGPFPEPPLLSPAEQRLRLFDGVARCLVHLAGDRGLLLFMDDLQWADQASISLLHYLVRLVARERVLILGCYRDTELDRAHPLAEAIDDWNRERTAVRVHLGRLGPEGTSAMLSVLLGDGCLPDELRAEIHRETDGNPFFVEEVVKTLVNEGQIVCRQGRWRRHGDDDRLVLPQGVKAAIGRRLDQLDPATIEALRGASILGASFSFADLALVTGAPEDELLDAIDDAVAAQLLEVAAGETVAFTHDKIREVLYSELNPIRRRRLHRRFAEGLEALRAGGVRVPAADLAHHSMEGGCLDRGFDYAMEAADDAAALFAWGDAIRLYERARDCAEALDRSAILPAVDIALGDVLGLKGEPLRAAEAYERALAATVDAKLATTVRTKLGEAYGMVGDPRALTAIEDLRTTLEPETQPAELARAMMVEARFHHYHGQSARAAEILLRASDLAERTDDAVLRAWIFAFLAGAYQHLARFEDSNRWARRCIALGDDHGNPGLAAIGHEFLMENAFMRGRWRECLEHTARHRELGERVNSSDRLAWNHLGRTYANLGLGELDKAESACREGLEMAERLGDERLAVFLAAWQAEIAVERGLGAEAVALAERAVARGDALGLKTGQLESRRARAAVAMRQGDHATALELTRQIEELLRDTDEAVQPVWTAPVLCASLVAVGRLDEAEERLQVALDRARSAGMPHFEAMALGVRGRLHAARGALDLARADLDAAMAIFAELGSRPELDRSRAFAAGLADRRVG